MAYLGYPVPEEVQLRLDAAEDNILTVARRCTWWTRAEVRGRLPESSLVDEVVLTADRSQDETIRDILLRSFQLVFPPDGGLGTRAEPKVVARAQRLPR